MSEEPKVTMIGNVFTFGLCCVCVGAYIAVSPKGFWWSAVLLARTRLQRGEA